MKNGSVLILFVFVALSFACNNANQKDSSKPKEAVDETSSKEEVKKEYTLNPEKTELQFTAYKTTDKLPVKGVFKTLNFEQRSATDLEGLLNGLTFSIPVSSLFTNDATQTRDPKIKDYFFAAMKNTEMLSGNIFSENGEYLAEVTMNDVKNTIPLKINVSDDNVLTAIGNLNLQNWDALDALISLNKVCFDLHKGSDGVSKTWEDVKVEITAKL